MMYVDFILFASYGCLGFIGIGVLTLLMMRARSLQKEKQRIEIFTKYRPYFSYLQQYIEDNNLSFHPLRSLNNMRDITIIQNQFIEWIGKLKGEQRAKLTRLCEDMGLVKKDLNLLDSMFYARRMQAAFRLGGMCSALAVPKLLDRMEKEKDRDLMRVISRAIARCAEDSSSLAVMLRKLLQCEQINEWFAVRLLEESSLDATPFLIQFLEEDNGKLVKTALLELNRQTPINVSVALTSALLRLVNNQDRDIRALAVTLLIRMGNVITGDTIRRWLSDPEWQVRAAVVESLASCSTFENILILKQALTDSHWQVCYSSSKSLATMGDEGFWLLCEAAFEKDGTYKSNIAKDRIHEELLRELYFMNHQEQKSIEARKCLLYEQYIDKTSMALSTL